LFVLDSIRFYLGTIYTFKLSKDY